MSIALLPIIGIMLYGSYKQLVLGEVWGNKPISDIALIIITLIVVILTLAITWFIFNLELIVEIKNKQVHYKLRPIFSEKVIHFSELESWVIKPINPINPITQFGGYGWRVTPKSKAFIINGKNALFLKPKEGKKIVLDTNKPIELKAFLDKEWQRFKEY